MSENRQSEPGVDGSKDAAEQETLAGLIEQVDRDHGGEGAAAMADQLRDRVVETAGEPENSGDAEE